MDPAEAQAGSRGFSRSGPSGSNAVEYRPGSHDRSALRTHVLSSADGYRTSFRCIHRRDLRSRHGGAPSAQRSYAHSPLRIPAYASGSVPETRQSNQLRHAVTPMPRCRRSVNPEVAGSNPVEPAIRSLSYEGTVSVAPFTLPRTLPTSGDDRGEVGPCRV